VPHWQKAKARSRSLDLFDQWFAPIAFWQKGDTIMVAKEIYVSRYRALGKKLEIERLRISEIMNEDFKQPLDKHRLSQDQFQDKCNKLLLELNELEDLLF
jgi:hypothetical protein